MAVEGDRHAVLSPIGLASGKKAVALAPGLNDLAGRTICAMRHLFRADETFPMVEALLRERFGAIRWISNHDMPDDRITSTRDEEALGRVLRERGCDLLIAGNAA